MRFSLVCCFKKKFLGMYHVYEISVVVCILLLLAFDIKDKKLQVIISRIYYCLKTSDKIYS